MNTQMIAACRLAGLNEWTSPNGHHRFYVQNDEYYENEPNLSNAKRRSEQMDVNGGKVYYDVIRDSWFSQGFQSAAIKNEILDNVRRYVAAQITTVAASEPADTMTLYEGVDDAPVVVRL